MLKNFEDHPQAAQGFYQTYFTDILTQVFSVVTDTSHTAGIQMHATILAYMFTLVEQNRITISLGPIPDNVLYVQEYVASLLRSAFGHLTDNQIKVFVTGLFNLDQDVQAFKEHLRDFLIQIRVSMTFPFTTAYSLTRPELIYFWLRDELCEKNLDEFLKLYWRHVSPIRTCVTKELGQNYLYLTSLLKIFSFSNDTGSNRRRRLRFVPRRTGGWIKESSRRKVSHTNVRAWNSQSIWSAWGDARWINAGASFFFF